MQGFKLYDVLDLSSVHRDRQRTDGFRIWGFMDLGVSGFGVYAGKFILKCFLF